MSAVPMMVGELLKTALPVPVSSVIAASRFALVGVFRNVPTPVPSALPAIAPFRLIVEPTRLRVSPLGAPLDVEATVNVAPAPAPPQMPCGAVISPAALVAPVDASTVNLLVLTEKAPPTFNAPPNPPFP